MSPSKGHYTQKTCEDFVLGYALNLCKIQFSVVPCNYKIR